MTPIPQELIEKALALTGKNYRDFSTFYSTPDFLEVGFFYYLLSPEFIDKYAENKVWHNETYIGFFGKAIYEYQKGNSAHIIELLTKI